MHYYSICIKEKKNKYITMSRRGLFEDEYFKQLTEAQDKVDDVPMASKSSSSGEKKTDIFVVLQRLLCSTRVTEIKYIENRKKTYFHICYEDKKLSKPDPHIFVRVDKDIKSGATGDVYNAFVQFNIGTTIHKGNIALKTVDNMYQDRKSQPVMEFGNVLDKFLDWERKQFCKSKCGFIPIYTSKRMLLPPEPGKKPKAIILMMLGDCTLTEFMKELQPNNRPKIILNIYLQIRRQIICINRASRYFLDLKLDNIIMKNDDAYLIDIDGTSAIDGYLLSTYPPALKYPITANGRIPINNCDIPLASAQTVVLGIFLVSLLRFGRFRLSRLKKGTTLQNYTELWRHIAILEYDDQDIHNYVTQLLKHDSYHFWVGGESETALFDKIMQKY